MPPDTRQRILATARRLFNDEGVHRVGVRDLARALDMRVGNLSYHFATKDELVGALLAELREINRATAFAYLPGDFSLATLFRAAVVSMRNTLDYRFALLSYVDAVRASPELLREELELATARRRRTEGMLDLLVSNEHLDPCAQARVATLHEQAEMISSGWLRAAALRSDLPDERAAVLHYAKLGCALLEPHCTPSGAAAMREILDGAHDAAVWPV